MLISRPSDNVFEFRFWGELLAKLHRGVVFSLPAGSVPLRTECGPGHAGVSPGPADHEHAAPDPLAGKRTLISLLLRAFFPRLGVCPSVRVCLGRFSGPSVWKRVPNGRSPLNFSHSTLVA